MVSQLRSLFSALADGQRQRLPQDRDGGLESSVAARGRAPSIDDTPAGRFTLDRDGAVDQCNTRYARLVGISDPHGSRPDHLLGDESARARWRSFLAGDAAALELHACVRLPEGGETELLILLERAAGGGFAGAVCEVQELSARLASLDGEVRLLREVIANAPVGIATLSEEGRIGTVWNPAAEAMLGWPADDVRGQAVPLLPAPLGLDRDGAAVHDEVRRWRGDGASIDLSISMARLIGDKDAVVAILEDVTDRLVREGERRRLDEIVRATPDLVMILDVDGRVLYLNPSARARLGEAAIGARITAVLGAGWDLRWREEVLPMVAGGGSWSAELELGAESITASVMVVGHRAHDARLAFLSVLARDISEQRSVENQLRQSQKLEALGQLAGGIAHDFNNLLTVVHANAELLRDRIADSDADLLVDIEGAARRGRDLVRRLMVFSRKDTLRLQPFRVAALEDYIRTLRRLLPETVAVRWVSAAPDAMIETDPGAIEQILLNLATNARDAMPQGGALTISITTTVPDQVRISVGDTGTGMPAAVRDRIFEPFFTTKAPGSGTGLGLSMVYGLVRQLRGSLEVESEPGHGTTFHMTFSRISDTSVVDVPEVRVVEAPRHPGCTILVVEDEVGIRRVLERSLKRVGHTVLTAGDGIEALEVLRVHDDIALVVSDMVMPKLGGPELLERARADGCTLPFLFMSGYDERETRNRAGLSEDTVVLSKPWTSEGLHDAVQRALDASMARVDTS